MEKLTPTPDQQSSTAPESIDDGRLTFDDLQREVPFNPPNKTIESPITPIIDKSTTLTQLHQQIKSAYHKDLQQEPLAIRFETSTYPEDDGIIPKERSKFDLIGKMQDKSALAKLDSLILQSIDESDPTKYLAQAQNLLNPYVANDFLEYVCTEWPNSPMVPALLESFSSKVLYEKLRKSADQDFSAEAVLFFDSIVSTPGKTQDILTDLVATDIVTSQPYNLSQNLASNHARPVSFELASLSAQNHEKLFSALYQVDNIDGAVQLLTPEIGQKYQNQLADHLNTPHRLAYAAINGGLKDLAPPDFTDFISSVQITERTIVNFHNFSSFETMQILGPALCEKSLSGSTLHDPIDEQSATLIKNTHDAMLSQHLDFGAAFMLYLDPTVSAIVSDPANLTPQNLRNLNFASRWGIRIHNLDDLKNFDSLVQSRISQEFDDTADDYDTIQDSLVPDMLCEYYFGATKDSLKNNLARIGLIKRTKEKDDYDQKESYSHQRIDKFINNNHLNPEAEATLTIAMGIITTDSPSKLKTFYDSIKGLANPDIFAKTIQELSRQCVSETTANFNSSMLTPEKVIASDATKELLHHQDQEIPVYHIDGQKFSILAHKLGAFGAFDTSDPTAWNTREKGNPYISTTLISNKCLKLAGGTSQSALQTGVYYGFSHLDDQAILTMSSYDLATYDGSKHFIHDDKAASKNQHTAPGRTEHWYRNPDDLLTDTLLNDSSDYGHNEVVINRCHEDDSRLQPDCILVFGTSLDEINLASREHAAYFNIPIYLINDQKCQKQKGIK